MCFIYNYEMPVGLFCHTSAVSFHFSKCALRWTQVLSVPVEDAKQVYNRPTHCCFWCLSDHGEGFPLLWVRDVLQQQSLLSCQEAIALEEGLCKKQNPFSYYQLTNALCVTEKTKKHRDGGSHTVSSKAA